MDQSPENMPTHPRFSLKKEERLRSKKQIEKLFSEGNSFLVYPLKVVYTELDFPGKYPAKAAFTVSKKLFKKAVRRNLIKRRMREAYRLNKHQLYAAAGDKKMVVIFIYVGKELLPYQPIEKAMKRAVSLLAKKFIPNP